MITEASTFYERRKRIIGIDFNDRRVAERRVDQKVGSPERRRLASQVRRYERDDIRIPVRLQAYGVEVSGSTENISLEGILIYSNAALETGTATNLQFSFGEGVCYTNIVGQVVSCRLVENHKLSCHAIGIRFNAIRDFESKILNAVIQILKQNVSSQEKSLLNIIITNDSLSQEATTVHGGLTDPLRKRNNASLIKNPLDKVLPNGRSEHINNTKRPILELLLSYPKGEKIVKEVLDLTEAELSFKMASEEGFFSVGTPLDSILVRNKKKTYKTSGEVINVTPFEEAGNQFFRIGVRLKGNLKGTLGSKRTSLFPLVRLPRYSADQLTSRTKFINFKTETTENHIGTLLDFSIFGTKFSLTERIIPPLTVGQKVHDFVFIIENELLNIGNATIIHINETDSKLTVGVSFESNTLDPNKIFFLDKKNTIKNEITEKTSLLSTPFEINPAFKSEVVDLRCFLEKLKREFHKYDLQNQNEEAEYKNNIERLILDSAVKHYYPIINASMSNIASLVENLDQHLDLLHKDYFRQHLHALFLEAPFINRAYRKPSGYAGDYEMMNMLYRDPYEGKTLFGKFLNNHIYQSPAAQAVRNRVPFLTEKIEMIVRGLPLKSNASDISVASIGCGPAKELQDFLTRFDNYSRCKFSLIDSDKNALQFCQDKILEIELRKKLRTKTKFIHKSVIEIVREKESFFSEKQDLIYSVGLFDYLKTDFSKQLIRMLFENLNSNGVLVVGNFDPSCPTKNYLEYTMEWYLIYRDNSEMIELADLLKNIASVDVEKEPEKVNNFLVIKKGG